MSKAAVQAPCPWHAGQLSALYELHQDNRLPHALLLSGPAGIGKRRLARALIELLLCQSPRAGLACGECQGCHLSVAGSHPDLFLLEPAEPGKGIRIDPVRELVDFGARTAQFSGYRVALIQPAEGMNRNAQNALLKTLEEPGEKMLLVLVSDQPSRLLPTVRSRCQLRLLSPPALPEARDWLATRLADPGQAAALLAAAGGAPLRALDLEQSDWFADREKLLKALVRVAGSPRAVPEASRELAGQDLPALVDLAWNWATRAVRLAVTGNNGSEEDTALAPLLAQWLERAGQQRLLDFSQALLGARRKLASGANPNPELLLESLLLELAGVDAGGPEI